MIVLLLLATQLNADEALVDQLAGEYLHAGGEADQRAFEAAIDRVVGEMMWLARDIARSRLKATNSIPKKLRIARAADRVRIAFDGRERETAVGAKPVKIIGVTGDELEYTLQILDGSLVQRFEGDGGGQLNVIRAQDDAIVVRVTVFSARLPANLVYELRYSRAR